jgi:hypothetical protein
MSDINIFVSFILFHNLSSCRQLHNHAGNWKGGLN